MGWQETRFERSTLYAEVWREAVTRVAKRYGISDVGLRKICGGLDVPVPPAGYWARVAAGQTPKVPPLPPSRETVYVRRYQVDERAPERESRIAALLATSMSRASSPLPEAAASPDDYVAIVIRTGRALARGKSSDPVRHASGAGLLSVSVSQAAIDRSLAILDQVVRLLHATGATFRAEADGKNLWLRFHGEQFEVSLTEKLLRSERELTPAERAKQARGEYFWIRDRYDYTATGLLTLSIVGPVGTTTISDGKRQRLEDRIAKLPDLLRRRAAQQRVEREMREEANARREAEFRERERRRAIREQNLARLKRAEEDAHRLERARRLRALADALTPSGAQSSEKRAAEAAWLRRAADWLDPTVHVRWPEVDDGPN